MEADAGRSQCGFASDSHCLVGGVVDASTSVGVLASGAAESVHSIISIRAGQANSIGRVEGGAAGSDINTNLSRVHILVGRATRYDDAVAVDVGVVGVALGAETLGVDLGAVRRILNAVSGKAQFVGLADSSGESAAASVVEEPARGALFAVLGDEVVEVAVGNNVGAWSIAKFLSLFAASERVDELQALSTVDLVV